MSDKVPIQPFRDAFERSGMPSRELAKLLGVTDGRARQLMGTKTCYAYKTVQGERKRYEAKVEQVTYEVGVRLCRALDLDPIDCGV